MKIVDPHVHIWDLSTGIYPWLEKPSTNFMGNNAPIARSYLLEELLAEGGDEFLISKIVNVEALPADQLGETIYLQALADRTGFPQAIVAAADLSDPAVERLLEKHTESANVRGIRQILNRHENVLLNCTNHDYMSNPLWRRNLGLLRIHRLSFDMQLYPHQIKEAAAVIAEQPDVQFIINHAAMFADRTLSGWKKWRAGLRTLAALENVTIKISGLGMLDHRWTIESIRPYVLETLDAFGTKKSMFASNFPADKLYGSYVELWRAFSSIVSDFADHERDQLFCLNAERIYRI
jgi:predicted TIM-barrel fold metal-dependent hydrolase